MKKRFLAMLLVLVMLVQLLPVTVLAKENDAKGGCVVSSGIQTNPLYANHRTPGAISPKYDSNYSLPKNANYVSTPEAAAAILRAAQENREQFVTFYYDTAYVPTTQMFYDIWAMSFAETGVPTQGDYLQFLWDYYEFEYYYEPYNGGYRTSITFEIYYYTTAEQEAYLTQCIYSLLESFPFTSETSRYEKILTVYQYICSHVTYDYDSLYSGDNNLMYTAYAALVQGTAVCQGYALLFYRLMRELNIPVRIISGDAGGPHAWNIVGIGGKYYNMDSTWDANFGSNYQYYMYFMRSSENFPDHYRDYEYTTASFNAQYPMGEEDYVYSPEDDVPEEDDIPEQKDGWVMENGNWVFYENGVKVTNAWRKDSKGWCYLGSDGAMLTNCWLQDSQGWCYIGADGYCETNCWKRDSYGLLYLNSEGSMTKNQWVCTDGKWYYLDADGYAVTDAWRRDSYGWCYLGSDGAMVTNCWLQDSKGWCYIGPDGYCETNCWKKDSYGWLYLDSEGSMTKDEWILDNGDWYYLDEEGYMVTGEENIHGTWYTFNDSGVWVA